MKFGLESMRYIVQKIAEGELPYQDHVVIGDNSSGKTLLLKLFLEKNGKSGNIYFIDAVNRNFDTKMVTQTEIKPDYGKMILKTRLQQDYFNLKDSFNCFGTYTERVEILYKAYENEIQDLFYELTKDRFQILQDDPFGEVDFGSGHGLLSSGYQAIIRILLELLYFQDMEVRRKQLADAWVVVDELDEFLSPRYASVILYFLKKAFPWSKWLITTHSCDLVANARDANLIILENSDCEISDINDYSTISQVQVIFERLFGKVPSSVSEVERMLRRLLNNKMSHAWGTQDEAYLKQLEKQQLTASQQLILRQIQEW